MGYSFLFTSEMFVGIIPPGTVLHVGPYPQLLTPSGGCHTYGWQASGTHPTGMHSCLYLFPLQMFSRPIVRWFCDADGHSEELSNAARSVY